MMRWQIRWIVNGCAATSTFKNDVFVTAPLTIWCDYRIEAVLV
jgi:hypothetical protein